MVVIEMPAELGLGTDENETANGAVAMLEQDETHEPQSDQSPDVGETNSTIDETNSTIDESNQAENESPRLDCESQPEQLETKPVSPLAIFEAELRAAQDIFIAAAINRVKCEAELKNAKLEEKTALKTVQKLIERGPESLPLFDQRKKQEPAARQAPDAVDPPAGDSGQAWRNASIAELDLKEKLREKLEESGATTIGTLEDLRADISQGKKEWPKGIGPAKVTQIEDAVIDWLSKNRDARIFQAAAEAATEVETKAESIEFDRWEEMTDEEQQEFILHAAERIKAAGNLGENKTDAWDSGAGAFGRWPIVDCPYAPGSSMDDWLRGWLWYQQTPEGETKVQTDNTLDL